MVAEQTGDQETQGPEERPVPPEPGKPEPTELDYLKRIADALDKKEA